VTGRKGAKASKEPGSKEIPTELSMTSRITYFNDRVIPPEGMFCISGVAYNLTLAQIVMRAMAIYYLGTSPKHLALHSDYFMSPVLTPPDLLSQFPPTYFLTGERDPFVDDTMIFSSKLRKAGCRGVKVEILEGVSHGVLLFVGMLPVANQAVKLVADWMRGLLVPKGQSDEDEEQGKSKRVSMDEEELVIGHRFIDKRRNEMASRHLK
jgi:acetyl esterase/lipase